MMRKPRDYDAELKALTDKAKALKEDKLRRLGELVVATGADQLSMEILAGALLAAKAATDMVQTARWRAQGEAMFSGGMHGATTAAGGAPARDRAGDGGKASA
jgi:DNA-binding protein H-NS